MRKSRLPIIDGHNFSRHPAYAVWFNMRARCHRPRHREFKNYGARGIVVCDRWRDSLQAFVADMWPPPSSEHEIDRIDNDGPYAPENCRWATRLEQMNNQRKSRFIEWRGERRTISQWSRIVGLHQAALRERIKVGWPVELAMTTPSDPHNKLRVIQKSGVSR
jgi:hypothetical protein